MTKLFQSKDVSCVCKSSFITGRDVLDCPSCHNSNAQLVLYYCAFHKHANFKVQKPPSQAGFSLPSIIITITSNEPWNTETHKRDRNPPITHHKPWPFEPVKVKCCFLRGSLRWLTAVKNAIVSWLLNFRIRMFVKSAVIKYYKNFISLFITMNLYQFQCLFVFFFGTYTHKLPSNPYISVVTYENHSVSIQHQ